MGGAEDTDFGRELIASMQEAAAILRGDVDAARVHLTSGDVDVRALRELLGLSRPAFAQRFGLAVATVRDWEQGLRRPDPVASLLLMVRRRWLRWLLMGRLADVTHEWSTEPKTMRKNPAL